MSAVALRIVNDVLNVMGINDASHFCGRHSTW